MDKNCKATRPARLIRIAITGPESTGKSKLAEGLAEHYQSNWVPEFARSYLMELNRPYHYEDILHIAKSQEQQESEVASRSEGILFCDTDFLVLKIWCDVKYNACHPWILQKLNDQHYDHYLLCDIDLPWEDDPLREHPHMRRELFDRYLYELSSRHFPFTVISGIGDVRLGNAILVIDTLMQDG